MERRLLLARDLLADTGVIIVAIGDDEHHRLRMLLDQVLGPENFVANVTWQGNGKNDAKYTAGGVDYMLMYAKDAEALVLSGHIWREPKPGIEQVLEIGADAWSSAEGDPEQATNEFRKRLKSIRDKLDPAVYRYDRIDDRGRIYQPDNLTSPNMRENLRFDLLHPDSAKPVKTPENGWRYSRSTMDSLLSEGRIIFGKDEKSSPRYKRFLTDQLTRVPYPSFVQSRMPGSKRLEGMLGDRRFPNPKDDQVIARWIGSVASSEAVVLDFFGGSGTVVESVIRLNAADGGSRSSILVTNNELSAADARVLRQAGRRDGDEEWDALGVYEHVVRPRLSTVTTGVRPDGSPYENVVPANVEFFTLTYEASLRVASNREFERIAPLLWMRAGARGRRIDDISDGWDVADTYGVLADFDHTEAFLKKLAQRPEATHAFVVTDDDWRLFRI